MLTLNGDVCKWYNKKSSTTTQTKLKIVAAVQLLPNLSQAVAKTFVWFAKADVV